MSENDKKHVEKDAKFCKADLLKTDLMKKIEEENVAFVNLMFTDSLGQQKNLAIASKNFSIDKVEDGFSFDGSSIEGWKPIDCSDLLLELDLETCVLDPFANNTTMNIICNVIDTENNKAYDKCPRNIAAKAEKYLLETGIGDVAYFGPEPEFFMFDDVKWTNNMQKASFEVDCEHGAWNTNAQYPEGNNGYRAGVKGGYCSVAPKADVRDILGEMCNEIENMGIPVEIFHNEVASCQHEIGTKYASLLKRADWTQLVKYVIKNVAVFYKKTVTFMPKPLVGDNGSGMHVHQSIWKDGTNLFAGNNYANLSDLALYYIGGIIKHGKALNAITNPSINSYKRLLPGFEAPVKLAYSSKNRSASIRIPYSKGKNAVRIETRFPDPLSNPYLCFSALLMAGLDGIQNKIHPGEAASKDLYHLTPKENAQIPNLSASLEEALDALDKDRDFLLKGGVFTNEVIDSYLDLVWKEALSYRTHVSALEYDLYYSR